MKEWEKELQIYTLNPAPPKKRDLQEYIVLCLTENNENYFSWFLHYYERTVNDKVIGIVQDYAMYGHFLDIKQAYITGMYKALMKYDLSRNVPFVVFKEYAAMREVHDYIRTMRGLTIQSSDEYLRLRKVMRLYREYGQKTDDATIQRIASELQEKPGLIKNLLPQEFVTRSLLIFTASMLMRIVKKATRKSPQTEHPIQKSCFSK